LRFFLDIEADGVAQNRFSFVLRFEQELHTRMKLSYVCGLSQIRSESLALRNEVAAKKRWLAGLN